jgi:hypothetical protein
MTDDERWHVINNLSTATAYRILSFLGAVTEPIDVRQLAVTCAVAASVCRQAINQAVSVGFAHAHVDPHFTTITYSLTVSGAAHVRGVAAKYDAVIDVNAAAIDINDQPSLTSMTARRGRPDWCTPGHGVCTGCTEIP